MTRFAHFLQAAVLLCSTQLCAAAVEIEGSAIAATDQGGDWRAYGRTYSEQRYSPLKQVNDKNVDRLRLDWYLEMPDSRSLNATPLVVDGVMYFTASQSVVMAVDAASGKLLWRYDPEVIKRLANRKHMRFNWGSNRGVAFWKGRVYVATFDGRLIALEAGTTCSCAASWRWTRTPANTSGTTRLPPVKTGTTTPPWTSSWLTWNGRANRAM